MIKFIAFDLDGTLAKQGKGLKPSTVEYLKNLEEQNVRVAICSGKTSFYLCGLLRQLELKQPIIIGENGADIQFGTDLPPKIFHFARYPKKVAENLIWLESQIKNMFNNEMWFQPNRIGVTPFPRVANEFDTIRNFLNENKERLVGLDVYEHCDCFDIVPSGISKKEALKTVAKMLNIKECEMAAMGDGVNDYPMFEIAGLSVGINLKDPSKVDINFESIDKALEYINKTEVLNKTYCQKQYYKGFSN